MFGPNYSGVRRFCLGLLLVAAARGAVVGGSPAPLTPPGQVVAPPSTWLLRLGSADRALQLGFSPVAAGLYRELLAAPEAPPAARNRVVLALASALLDQDDNDGAGRALEQFFGLRTPAWHLRAGLLAVQSRRIDAAVVEAAAVPAEELAPADRGWWFYLQGMIASAQGDPRAAQWFGQALGAAVSDQQRAHFALAQTRAKLLFTPATEAIAEQLRKFTEDYQGKKLGYDSARQYAIVLALLNRPAEAIAVLQHQLQAVPATEKAEIDDFRLLLGLTAGVDSGVGRNAFKQLLADAASRDTQRVALHLLARGSTEGEARREFAATLGDLISAPAPHPLLEDLLACRAQLALADQNYAQAEDDAKMLLARFPGSPLKANALGVLGAEMWELKRYRAAADYLSQLRAELTAGDTRAELGVLLADAYFRATDFKNAAGAYGSALREPPTSIAPGLLIFQRVLAEINADQLDTAQPLLDELAGSPDFDAEDRWQAEWNLARALQVRGRTAEAYARTNRLLQGGAPAALPADLHLRMAWLQARLSFEAGRPAETVTLVDALVASVQDAALAAAVKTDVVSTSLLLKAQAYIALGRAAPALELLKRLRADYPKANAAVYSYIIEAKFYADQNEIVEAQQLLTRLADDFRDSDYAPYALYEAALNAEKRGQDAYLQEAYKLLERIVGDYPRSDLLFYARLRQGDLLRKLNQFGAAQQVYELLVNRFAQHEDVLLAQLALADCHYAQAANDPSHFESAVVIFERLQDLPAAPVDLRAEAGFKYGYALARHGDGTKAQTVWWAAADLFLRDPKAAAGLGAKGRYWMSRVLLELGGLFEQQANLEKAREAYALLLRTKLPGEALARARLARFDGGEAK
jgi:TolA-binding protein